MQIRDTRVVAQNHQTKRTESTVVASQNQETFAPEGASGRIDLQDLYTATRVEATSLEAKLPDHVPGQVLVKVEAGFSLQGLNDIAKDYGATVEKKFDLPSDIYQGFDGELMLLNLPEGMSTADAMAMMGKDDRVKYAAANERLYALDQPAQDKKFPKDLNDELWGMHNTGQTGGTDDVDIDASQAWAQGDVGSHDGPLMMVLDSGIDYEHEALQGNVWTNPGEIPGNGIDDDGNGVIDDVHGFNAINGSGNPMDDNAHGTHCAGTIAGNGTNGVYGVNHKANVMGVKFLDGRGGGTLSDAIEGLLYGEKMGVKLASHSWGGGGFNRAMHDIFKNSKALHIAAAGNESNDNDAKLSFPASYDLDNIISVAATDHNDRLANFSNYGKTTVDLAAPGVDILSTVPSDKYSSFSGTSMATPHVAGVAYAIMSKFPEASREEVLTRLLRSVDKVDGLEGKVATGGRLNMLRALEVDKIAPGKAKNFALTALDSRRVGVSFTASGDDGYEGEGIHYEIRYSDKPIVFGEPKEGEVSWKQAAVVGTGETRAAGEQVSTEVLVPVSEQDRKLYYAVVQSDNVGNLGAIESQAVDVPKANVLANMEFKNGLNGFELEGRWGLSEVDGKKVLSDSPGGNYDNGTNASAISPAFDLGSLKNTQLLFDSKYELEHRYDHLYVEVSRLNKEGEPEGWSRLTKFSGSQDWAQHGLDLSKYDGQEVKVRFRMETDGSKSMDGFSMEKVMIIGDPVE